MVLHAYQDHLGFWTIGIGRLIDKQKGGGISEKEAEFLLDNDIEKCIIECTNKIPFFTRLDKVRQDVLVSMCFQMGIGGLLKFKATLEAIEKGDYSTAKERMLNSLWAKQTPNRAKELAEMIETGSYREVKEK